MNYHFKIHKDKKGGYWGECMELEGCRSEGDTLEELKENLKEALDLYLDEPEDSKTIFPLPKSIKSHQNYVEITVDPQIALAFTLRMARLKRHWTQKKVAESLHVPLYSYQRLERSKTANPTWKTIVKLCRLFPDLKLQRVL